MSSDPSANMHRERNYTEIAGAVKKPPGGEENVIAEATLKAEPTTWNPQSVEAGGRLDPMYHQTRITETMVQDPISALKAQIFVSPLQSSAEQIRAKVAVPPPAPPKFDKDGNQINPWDTMSTEKPQMSVINPAGLAPTGPHGAHGIGMPPEATVPTRTPSARQAEIASIPGTSGRVESPTVASRMAETARPATHELSWLGSHKALEPNKTVGFKTVIGLHSSTYHEVIITDRVITLIYDTRYKGTLFLPHAPALGESVSLLLSYNGREYPTYNIGGIFETGCLTCLTLLRSPDSVREEMSSGNQDPFSGQAAQLIDMDDE